MVRLKFYTDEHISKAVVKGLRARGVDIVSCVDVGNRTASDVEHLNYAEGENRVVVTYDNDFLKLHEAGHPHGGIAFSHRPLSIGEMIGILLLMHEVFEDVDMRGKVEFIP